MGHWHANELAAGMLVIGYLLEQPANAAGLAQRLADDMPPAKFARTSVNNALKRLEAAGCVRKLNGATELYEALPEGGRQFSSWHRSGGGGIPPIREPIHGKLLVSRLENRDHMIKMIRNEELACAREFRAAHTRMQAISLQNHGHPNPPAEWPNLVREIVISDEVELWKSRVVRLKHVRARLEALPNGRLAAS